MATRGWNLVETMGGGGGFVDFDEDGLLDIYLVSYTLEPQADGAAPRDALYRNNGDGTFSDVTSRARLGGPMRGMGLAVGDYDNDGGPDLYVSGFRRQRLYHNNRNGTFTDVTAAAGLGASGWGTSAAFFDYDGDGDLDLFVCHYLDIDPDAPLPCQMIGDRPFCSIDKLRGSRSALYRNDGGRFTEVGAAAGVALEGGKGLGVVAADLDGDGRVDLFQANDTAPNFLFKNRGDGTFAETGLASDVAFDASGRARGAMGVDVDDYDQDGRLDLFVTNFTQQGYSLFRNAGGGAFRDMAREMGLVEPSLPLSGFGARFLDEDGDGWPDLVVANGHPFEPVATVWPGIRYAEPALLFEGTEKVFRVAAPERAPALARPMAGRGLAVGDIDNDGDADILLMGVGEPPRLLRNDGGNRNHWLGVRLEGSRSNRDGVGAVVRVTAGGRPSTRARTGGTSYASASDPRLLFGLGSAVKADRLEVRWPSGLVSVMTDVPANQYVLVREESAR